MDIGEIATASTGDLNLLSDALILLQKQDAFAPSSRHHGAEHPGGTATDYHDIILFRFMNHTYESHCQPLSDNPIREFFSPLKG